MNAMERVLVRAEELYKNNNSIDEIYIKMDNIKNDILELEYEKSDHELNKAKAQRRFDYASQIKINDKIIEINNKLIKLFEEELKILNNLIEVRY
jgi:hypothetical protein